MELACQNYLKIWPSFTLLYPFDYYNLPLTSLHICYLSLTEQVRAAVAFVSRIREVVGWPYRLESIWRLYTGVQLLIFAPHDAVCELWRAVGRLCPVAWS